jgi:hypothetical protein
MSSLIHYSLLYKHSTLYSLRLSVVTCTANTTVFIYYLDYIGSDGRMVLNGKMVMTWKEAAVMYCAEELRRTMKDAIYDGLPPGICTLRKRSRNVIHVIAVLTAGPRKLGHSLLHRSYLGSNYNFKNYWKIQNMGSKSLFIKMYFFIKIFVSNDRVYCWQIYLSAELVLPATTACSLITSISAIKTSVCKDIFLCNIKCFFR